MAWVDRMSVIVAVGTKHPRGTKQHWSNVNGFQSCLSMKFMHKLGTFGGLSTIKIAHCPPPLRLRGHGRTWGAGRMSHSIHPTSGVQDSVTRAFASRLFIANMHTQGRRYSPPVLSGDSPTPGEIRVLLPLSFLKGKCHIPNKLGKRFWSVQTSRWQSSSISNTHDLTDDHGREHQWRKQTRRAFINRHITTNGYNVCDLRSTAENSVKKLDVFPLWIEEMRLLKQYKANITKETYMPIAAIR